MDTVTYSSYRAEWALEEIEPLKDSYYTLSQAKAVTENLLAQPWFQETHEYCMKELGFYMNPELTQIRKGKPRPKNGQSASVRFHRKYGQVFNYASFVFNSHGGPVHDVARRSVIHEAAHFLAGPTEGHGGAWRAIYVVLMEKCGLVAESAALEASFRHFRVPPNQVWLDDMRYRMGV